MSSAISTRLLRRFDDTKISRNRADFRLIGELLGFDLVAHRFNGARVRTDPDDTFLRKRLREACPLRQEAIARMHSFSTCLLTGCNDLVCDQIRLSRCRGADVNSLIGHLNVQRIPIGI